MKPPQLQLPLQYRLLLQQHHLVVAEGITVKNKGINAVDLHIEVSGVPAGWVDVIPESISLSPEESKGFNLIITVPEGTVVGDYRLLITLKNSVVEDSNFMIIRVRDFPAGYDKPIVTRTVNLDYENNKTKINLDVNNP